MTLWEQLTHLQYWQELLLKNIKEGKPNWYDIDWSNYPPDFIDIYGDWEAFKKAIMDSILELQQIIKDSDNLAERFPGVDDKSLIHLARVFCSHMSYHISQIVMTRKLLGLWPPLGYFSEY